MTQPLEGIRVIDLSRILAGPFCSMVLGDLGAEVIKIEQPGTGDDTRGWGPPFIDGESAYFLCINRNKKSLTLNLKHDKGKRILKDLVKKADVLLENFRPGGMEEFGLGYEVLREINPRLIYCSITGFGSTGPYKDKAGYDVIVSAVGGLMSITGEPGGRPVKVGVAVTDIMTGLFAQGAIAAALIARERTGKGQKIELSLLETQVATLINIGSSYLLAGEIPQKWGSGHASIVPYQAFQARDDYLIIGVGNDRLWRKFCQVTGLEDLTDDPRFATNPQRVKNREVLVEIIEERLRTRTVAEWLQALDEVGIPCGPINTIDKVFQDPQVLHLGMVAEMAHPTLGVIKMAGIPVKYSETPALIKSHPPLLGEHTGEVLRGILGYGEGGIAKLREEGVI